MSHSKIRRALGMLGVVFAVTAAPVFAGQQTGAKSDPPPRVQDCGIVTISTPNKYICNGKVYTSYQLQQLREKAAAQAAANAARYSKAN